MCDTSIIVTVWALACQAQTRLHLSADKWRRVYLTYRLASAVRYGLATSSGSASCGSAVPPARQTRKLGERSCRPHALLAPWVLRRGAGRALPKTPRRAPPDTPAAFGK